jgi:hypothetical protein
MIARPAEDEALATCLATLEASLAGAPSRSESLADFSPRTLEAALHALAQRRGEAALAFVTSLAESAATKEARKAARRVLYRLGRAGIAPLPPREPRPVVERRPERALRAWVSGVDGTGSRAVWIVIEGAFGGLALCALIVNDQVGILEVAGGAISKKRLEGELKSLRQSQKLPWLEWPPAPAAGLVAEALALHARLGTEPPPEFSRWRGFFQDAPDEPPPPMISAILSPAEVRGDPTLLDHSAELLELPELASWFVNPDVLQSEALELLQARESRLVLSDQIKAEREGAIVERVVERAFTADARRLWARRLTEMAWVLHATERPREARLAYATALALDDPGRSPHHLPFARGLAQRGLAYASDVALSRVSAAQVSRVPRP